MRYMPIWHRYFDNLQVGLNFFSSKFWKSAFVKFRNSFGIVSARENQVLNNVVTFDALICNSQGCLVNPFLVLSTGVATPKMYCCKVCCRVSISSFYDSTYWEHYENNLFCAGLSSQNVQFQQMCLQFLRVVAYSLLILCFFPLFAVYFFVCVFVDHFCV